MIQQLVIQFLQITCWDAFMSASYVWKKVPLIALPCQMCSLCWQMKGNQPLPNKPTFSIGRKPKRQLFLLKNLKFIRQMKHPFLIWIQDKEYDFLLLCCMYIRCEVNVRWRVTSNGSKSSQKVTIKKFRARNNWVQEC